SPGTGPSGAGPRGPARRAVLRPFPADHDRRRRHRAAAAGRVAAHPRQGARIVNTPLGNTSLNAARRAAELAGDSPVDVLVVGLGATGAGVALDAASRGLTVTAIDAHDLAFGTSRWSSKLIHGGLRYLASGQLDVAYESA